MRLALRAALLFATAGVALGLYAGVDVAFQDYPFFATLILSSTPTFTSNVWICGSTLVHESYVLTAAHCTQNAVGAYVYLNSTVSLTPWVPGPAVYATEIITNPAYSSITIYNDLGLIKLPHPVPTIPRLTLASTHNDWDALATCATVDVLGRGKTCSGGCLSNVLRKTSLPKIPYADCVSGDYSAGTWLPAAVGAHLCLGFENSCLDRNHTEQTCQGDSGGPGYVGSLLYGVVSRGPAANCGNGTRPDIFVNVADAANVAFLRQHLLNSSNASSPGPTTPGSSGALYAFERSPSARAHPPVWVFVLIGVGLFLSVVAVTICCLWTPAPQQQWQPEYWDTEPRYIFRRKSFVE